MERKTRQSKEDEGYSIDEAVKERFRINSRNIGAYMNGEWKMNNKVNSMLLKKQIKITEAEPLVRKANAIQGMAVLKMLCLR